MNSTEPDAINPLTVVESIVSVAATLVVAYVEICAVIGEDETRRIKAVVFKSAENYCQTQAMLWARMADACKTAYDNNRLVF